MGYKWEKNDTNKKVLQKVLPLAASSTSHTKSMKTPDNSPTNTCPSTCNMEDSIVEQSVGAYRVPLPPDGPPPPGHSQLQPSGQGSFMQRPLLLHAPHYIFNL